MEGGSPSRAVWAEVADSDLPPSEEFFDESLGLLREFVLARGPEGWVALSDSEDYSDEDSSPPTPVPGKGKVVASAVAGRRCARWHRRACREPEGFMAAARRADAGRPKALEPPLLLKGPNMARGG